uniref:leucine-rich repeat-containing protein 39-like isoform X1 n=1 Tax=Myxine glutinosa TaxID=7769 RepID=UPI00358FC424
MLGREIGEEIEERKAKDGMLVLSGGGWIAVASVRAVWERRIKASEKEAERAKEQRKRTTVARLAGVWEERITLAELKKKVFCEDGRLILKIINEKWTVLPGSILKLGELWGWTVHRTIMRALPSWLGSCGSLRSLDLARNGLRQIPPEIGELRQLEELNLSYNRLLHLPAELGQCQSLQRLELAANHELQDLPLEVSNLSSLYHLDMSVNMFSDVPPAICNLPALEWLDMSSNQLESLPDKIGQLQKLHSLWLQRNRLVEIPSSLCTLPQLSTLVLASNRLTSLPYALRHIPNLMFVNLTDNPLEPQVELPLREDEDIMDREEFGMEFLSLYLDELYNSESTKRTIEDTDDQKSGVSDEEVLVDEEEDGSNVTEQLRGELNELSEQLEDQHNRILHLEERAIRHRDALRQNYLLNSPHVPRNANSA